MANENQRQENNITPDKAAVWVDRVCGNKSAKDIARRTGKSERTIRRYVADFDEYIRQSEEFQDVADRITKMIPKALNVFDEALETDVTAKGSPAVRVAENIFKISGVIFERKQDIPNSDSKSDDELIDEIDELLQRGQLANQSRSDQPGSAQSESSDGYRESQGDGESGEAEVSSDE